MHTSTSKHVETSSCEQHAQTHGTRRGPHKNKDPLIHGDAQFRQTTCEEIRAEAACLSPASRLRVQRSVHVLVLLRLGQGFPAGAAACDIEMRKDARKKQVAVQDVLAGVGRRVRAYSFLPCSGTVYFSPFFFHSSRMALQ